MISGYPASASIVPGEKLVLHIVTSAPRFRVRFLRWGERAVPVHETGWLPGKYAAPAGPDQDWHWPAYTFVLPAGLPSAPYIAWLEEPGGAPFSLAAASAACLFVLRGAGASPILYKLPLATWHAYNYSGGGCFYQNPPRSLSPPGARVSFHRPGGGIGGPVWCAADHYDATSPRQTFAHWDAPFIRWLLRNGYAPEFCTGPCLHADPGLLDRYQLLLTAGHDEYWSEPERNAVEAFVARGGNLAIFGANTCWWRVHIACDGAAMTCHQGGPDGALDHWWPATGAARPEDSLSGLSYRHAGGWWDGPRETGGYAVQHAGHWIFDGTGLADGQRFGAATTPPLAGYECDGAPLASFDQATGRATLSPSAHAGGTPPSFQLLAASLLGDNWQERPARAGQPAGEGLHAAAMGIFSAGGTVFSAGTTDWAQVLASGQEPRAGIITRNVIERLQAR